MARNERLPFSVLKGCVVEDVVEDGDGAGNLQLLLMRKPHLNNGAYNPKDRFFQVEVWSDEEGNGAGYLYIERLPAAGGALYVLPRPAGAGAGL